jgi:hypothetical protein
VLPLLYNVPKSQEDWNIWSLSHAASHTKILQAIKIQKSQSLSQYQLDPIPFNAFDIFLNNNQQAHNDMLNALGISGSDLQEVDVKNENQLRAWVYLHAKEHADAEGSLKV